MYWSCSPMVFQDVDLDLAGLAGELLRPHWNASVGVERVQEGDGAGGAEAAWREIGRC